MSKVYLFLLASFIVPLFVGAVLVQSDTEQVNAAVFQPFAVSTGAVCSTYTPTASPTVTNTPVVSQVPSPTQEFAPLKVCVLSNITQLNVRETPSLSGRLIRKARSGECFSFNFFESIQVIGQYHWAPVVVDGRNGWLAMQANNQYWAELAFDWD